MEGQEEEYAGEDGQIDCPPDELRRFCAEQIQIPPQLPNMLKEYTKAAIRTQPRCLLAWSAAYFRSLANGQDPPAKQRMEYPANEAPSGLTKGTLKVLHQQLGGNGTVTKDQVRKAWADMCLDPAHVEELFATGGLEDSFEWIYFLGLAAGSLGNTLIDCMKTVCEVMTTEPDGAEPYIDFETWWKIYIFMTKVDKNVAITQIEEVQTYLSGIAEANMGRIGPRNFLHVDCPQLQ